MGLYRLTATFETPVEAVKAARYLMDGFGIEAVTVFMENRISLDAAIVTVCPPKRSPIPADASAPARKWTGTMVKDLRRRRGLSLVELGTLLGWRSTGSVSNLESGRQRIGSRLAAKLEAIAAGAPPASTFATATTSPTVPRVAASAVDASAPPAKYTPRPPRTEPKPPKPPTVPLPRQQGHGFRANRCECAHTVWEHENDTGRCLNLVCGRQAVGCGKYRPRAAAAPPGGQG